jgi:beta-lactamase regulating signal transducer with metallopeptidase domain
MDAFFQIVASNALIVTALALGVSVVSRFWKHPIAMHLLWLLVLIKMLTPPLVTIPVPWLFNPAASLEVATSNPRLGGLPISGADNRIASVKDPFRRHLDSANATWDDRPSGRALPASLTRPVPWLGMLALVWIGGTLVLAISQACRIGRFREVLRSAIVPPADVLQLGEEMSQRIGLRKVPRVLLLPVRISPLVWSFGHRLRVLLPAEFFAGLSRDAQRVVLAHELGHVHRKDYLVRLLELITTTLFWWHPVVWWACRELQTLEEQCIDARVLELLPGVERIYADALLATVEYLAEMHTTVALSSSRFFHARSLQWRIKMIMERTAPSRLSWPQRGALLVSGALLLSVSLTALQAEPTTSESAAPKSGPFQASQGQEAGTTAPATKPARAAAATTRIASLDESNQLGDSLADLVRSARLNIELSETDLIRCEAMERQLAAIETAFDAGTVTVDQLLEAQRRMVDARVSYAKTVCKLAAGSVKGEYIFSLASLTAFNEALKSARRVWKKTHGEAVESSEESQARAQYFQVKAQVQERLQDYLKAKSAWEAEKDRPQRGPKTSVPG